MGEVKVGRNINIADESRVYAGVEILINSAVTAILPNPKRLFLSITITGKDAWIRMTPASEDPLERKGIRLKKDQTYEFPIDNVYTGEVSIINKKDNEKPIYYITEF